ncbi:MAG: hypothetical protein LBU61_06695, partial [Coriobacteriales bacterium]|nr:hypothetical protein [Coriobacteriales bacterium]
MLNVINSSQIPGQLRSLAALVLIIGQGKIDDLRALGFDIADSTAEQLAVLCPSLELDTQNLAFETTDELPTDLSDSLLTALLLCEREGERWDMSDQERLFERFSALAAALLDMGDPGRSMSLLKLTGQLLSVRPGLILPGKRVFGSREPKASVRATAQERLDS